MSNLFRHGATRCRSKCFNVSSRLPHNWKVLRRVHPPGPNNGNPLVGVLFRYRKGPPQFLSEMARTYGDLVRMRLGLRHVYLVSHPDAVREILSLRQDKFVKGQILGRAKILLGESLLTSEGTLHAQQRRLMQPAFHQDWIARYGAEMVEIAARASDQWRPEVETDISLEMLRLTFGVVAKTLFSADATSDADEVTAALTQVLGLFEPLIPLFDVIRRLPIPEVRRFERARDRLDQVVSRLIAARRTSEKKECDLLSMLLLAQSETAGGDGLTDRDVRNQVITLLLAGYETVANGLTWAWYLLSQNPDAEAKFHAEIDSVLQWRRPSFQDVPSLPYTMGLFLESLRLFPPVWLLGRKTIGTYEIGDYRIPRGSVLLLSPWVVHRDSRWFPDPVRFNPDRWQPELAEARPKFSFFPFGGGSHVCIGERFAMTEGVLVLATLGQQWRMRLAPGHPVETRAKITLRPRHGMKMRLERRQAS